MRFFFYLERFLLSIKRYLFSSILNLIEISSQILIFICLIFWFSLVFNSYFEEFKVAENLNGLDPLLFYQIETQAKNFDFYRKIQAFTIFSLVLQTLKYLYFSKRMSRLLDVFYHAKLDFLFFLCMFAIVLIGFSLMAYFTFGVQVEKFNTFPKSILNCLILLIGSVNLKELVNADAMMGPIFYFSFMV